MANHPNRATEALAILDETNGGQKTCQAATAEKISTFRKIQALTGAGFRVVIDSNAIYGSARTIGQAAYAADTSKERVKKGIFRTYAPNGLGEVVDIPAWIVS